MVLLSSTVASFAGRRLGFSTRHLRILVGCGVAAGVACAYNTPIGAALFTMEIIVGNFALETFAPLVFASVTATLLARAVFGNGAVFNVPASLTVNGWELFACVLLGVLGGVSSIVRDDAQLQHGCAAVVKRSSSQHRGKGADRRVGVHRGATKKARCRFGRRRDVGDESAQQQLAREV